MPVASQPYLFGVKPSDVSAVADETKARFEFIAVGPDGARLEKPGVGWEIVGEEFKNSWYRDGGRWLYRSIPQDRHMAGGKWSMSPAAQPAVVEANLPSGAYRIEIFDPKGETASSARFHVGWSGSTNPTEALDSVELKPSKPLYPVRARAPAFSLSLPMIRRLLS